MADDVSMDGRTLVAVANDGGEVSAETRFHFEQTDDRIRASYAGGSVVEGLLVGTLEGREWDVRYVQLTEDDETATGHSVGTIEHLADGRVRVEDEWQWESRPGGGETVLEEVDE